MSFTEADNSLSVGMGLDGNRWSRPKDTLGLSFMLNGLSSYRRNYLQAGGVSYFIGDYASPTQTISYRPEQISELYYNATVVKNVLAGVNFQHISNPAYNAARGPVNILSFRIHAEFWWGAHFTKDHLWVVFYCLNFKQIAQKQQNKPHFCGFYIYCINIQYINDYDISNPHRKSNS